MSTPSTPETSERTKEAAPVIQVVSGQPSPEELAALVAVLSAAAGGGGPEPERPRSAWSDPARRLGGTQPRRGGWRASSLPR